MARLAVLESRMAECLPVLDRVISIEADMRHLNEDITELRQGQEHSRKERLVQYETLTGLINSNHEDTTQKIRDSMKYNDERLIRTFNPVSQQLDRIGTIFSTITWLLSGIGGTLIVIATIYMALPK